MRAVSRIILWLIFLGFTANTSIYGQIEFPSGSDYSYLKGIDASGLGTDWKDPGFDDSSWSVGNAPFRYGDGSGGTVLDDMQNSYTTLFLRTQFTASGIDGITSLYFTADFDDGFIIWINGERILEQNAPLNPNAGSTATALRESGVEDIYIVNADDVPLVDGSNTMAVLVLNENPGSSDLYFDVAISATAVYSDSVGISFSHPSGYYDSPFTLTISTPDAGADIYYTLDGSNPQNSPTAISSNTSAAVTINPASTAGGRGLTPAVTVRTSIGRDGYLPSYPQSRTYIFMDEVLTQSYPGGTWPDYDVNGQYIDLEMDPEIVNDSRYTNQMDDALLDIPAISIITDNANLWDPGSGIYVNAWGHGRDWERECNVELIQPDGSDGFEVNAGIRIRGGWSRHNEFPKHAFRLFFRSVYGDPKLYYPLFGEEGVDRYDKIDLRTAQNYAWSNGDSRNTMVREVFSRDMQRDMGQPYTRSRYYHLYLNGMYWGIFQTQERSEARYASDYFGGDNDDYDVVKVSTENWDYIVEATDGELNGWQQVYNLINRDMSNDANYFAIEGRDANGVPVKGAPVYVDIDNLIDYMLTIFYAGNFDAPTSSFGQNNGPNNFYAIYDRTDNSKGFIFLNHDAEHSMMVDETWPGVGITENRVNIGDRTDEYQMTVSSFNRFHPQWLHHKLCDNEEYRLRFADRAYMYMTGDGVLTESKNLERFNQRVSQIETAIIAESARWGDGRGSGPHTKDDHWLPVIQQVQYDFFGTREQILRSQLRAADLYPDMDAPILAEGSLQYQNGSYTLTSAMSLELENPNGNGILYYTLTGKDPRKPGGDIHWDALEAESGKNFNISASTMINARVYDNGDWSPLKRVYFISDNDDYSTLKVTELHYHPPDIIEGTDTTSGKKFEFIEFKNTGSTSLNLSGCVLDSAVYCVFPENSIVGPGQFFVAAAKPSYFYDTYGKVASANFSSSFSNGGEEVRLFDPSGEVILRFRYSDDSPWPQDPDGNGPSMVSVESNPTGNPDDPYYWRSSIFHGGSPFSDDIPLGIEDPATAAAKARTYVYPNPSNGQLHIAFTGEEGLQQYQVEIYAIGGKLLYKTADFNQSVDLSRLGMRPGIYIVRVTGDWGVETHKLIYSSY